MLNNLRQNQIYYFFYLISLKNLQFRIVKYKLIHHYIAI